MTQIGELPAHFPDSLREAVESHEVSSRFLSPSEVQYRLACIAENPREGLSAAFKAYEDEAGTFTTFEISGPDAEEDEEKVALLIDGVHTSEVVGGTAFVHLAEAIHRNPQMLKELGATKIIYYSANPKEQGKNDVLFRSVLPDTATFLKTVDRSAKDIDHGFPSDEQPEPQFVETQHVMTLVDIHNVVACFPLHNSSLGDNAVYVCSNFSETAAGYISRYICSGLQTDREISKLDEKKVPAKAPGVYDTSGVELNSGTYTKKAHPTSVYAAIELPYSRQDKEAPSETHQEEREAIQALGQEICALIEEVIDWKLPDNAPKNAQKSLASIERYYWPFDKRWKAIERAGVTNIATLIQALHFYTATVLGQTYRAANMLQKAGFSEYADYAVKAEKVIDQAAQSAERYFQPVEQEELIRRYMGTLAITLWAHNVDSAED